MRDSRVYIIYIKKRILTFMLFWRRRQLFLSHRAVKPWIPAYRRSPGQRLILFVIIILAGQTGHWRLRFGLDLLRFMSPLHSEQGCHCHQLSVTRSSRSWSTPHLTSSRNSHPKVKLPNTIPPVTEKLCTPF